MLPLIICSGASRQRFFAEIWKDWIMGYFDARFAAYLAIAAVLIVTPGPDMALVTRNALLTGRRAASFTTFGIGAGSVIWALASVFGIAVLFEESIAAFTIFKFVGAAYLGYLGLRSLIAILRGSKHTRVTTSVGQMTHHRGWAAFRQGFLSNLLNPKAGAIFATVFPQFINPGDPPLRLILMLLAYETIILSWLHLYGYLVSRAGQSRFGSRVRTFLQGVTGVVLLALGIRLAFEQK